MKVIITAILIVLLFISPSHAENIYIGEQAQGYDSGTDCLNRHSVAWFNNASNWGAVAGKIKAGDTIHLCGTINSPMIVNGSGMSGSPITILWERDAKLSRPTWSSGTGFITASNKSFIILDGGTNGILEATDNGTTAAFGGTKNYANDIYGIFFDNCISCEIRNLTIRGIYDRKAGSTDCIRAGKPIYWAGNLSGGAIHGNTVSDGFRCLFLPFTGTSTNGFNVYSNIIANCSVAINPAPSSETGHSAKNISIYSNTITGGNKWDGEFDSQCQAKGCSSSCLTDRWHHQDGIHAFAFSGSITDGLKIFSNYLQDFGTHSTAHIYIEGAGMTNTMIYNNVLVTTGDNYAANGDVAIKAATGTKVYDNTFVGNNRGAAVLIHSGAQNSDIKNNIIMQEGATKRY